MRILDIIISITALILLSPIFLLVTFIILASDFKSPFFLQLRRGKKGCFKIIKFRTMSTDLEVSLRKITPLGKYLRILSVDELPQLVNVLKGDMSIVGVRPGICELNKECYKRRPGITGLAQVSGRSNIEERKLIELNQIWEEKASVGLYCIVLLKTCLYIITLDFFRDAN
jgi:lipopolysaccharide/colanic/teichoic acid biosynthesis glycosyltransferase